MCCLTRRLCQSRSAPRYLHPCRLVHAFVVDIHLYSQIGNQPGQTRRRRFSIPRGFHFKDLVRVAEPTNPTCKSTVTSTQTHPQTEFAPHNDNTKPLKLG